MANRCKKLILGIGNRLRSDDAAGSIVAEKCKLLGLPSIDTEYMPENYIAVVRRYNPEKIIIVDTCDMALTPGEVRIVPLHKIHSSMVTTHGMPLVTLIEILQVITTEIMLIGIQPQNVDVGNTVSLSVQEAIKWLVDCLHYGREDAITVI